MLFSGVKYHLPSALPHERQSHLTALLTRHGAARADSVFDATHIITNTEVFDGWRDVKEDDVVIVSDLWVERSIAAGKIQQPSFYSANRSKIFSGVVACSADLLVSDEEVLSVGIVSLGGQWRMGLTKDVTHLFAVSTTSEKYCTGMSYRDQTNIKVLAPHWFDDTVLLGHPDLSTEIYEWPDPTVLKRRSDSSAQLKDAKKQQRNSMSPQKKALYKTATWDPSQPSELQSKGVWERRRILLSTTLELTGPRRKIVEANIRKSHGVPVTYTSNDGDGTSEEEFRLLDECDVFVTRYRTGPAFFKAWRKGKEIGTLSWLLNVQVTGVHSSPLDQILHFPIPTGAVKEFDRHEISVTNYTGESRDYLKKLITLMGGNFTPGLSIKNTVLVAAQMSGSKTAKAAEWSISVVNHTWLEDCFLRWQSLTPALPKYISYPTGIDFASILGERGVGPEIKDIIDAEAAKEGEDASQDGEDDDEDDEGGRRTTPHSQNSADETEVEGGLMPAMDVDNDNDNDINMDVGGGGDGDNLSEEVDFEMEDHRHNSPALSFEDALHSPRPETPTPAPWSPLKRKKRLRGLSTSSESGGELDPEVKKKVVRVEPPSAVKSPPKRKGKGRAPQSEAAASQSQDEDERPRKRAAVGMHTGPPPKKRSRGREVESEAEASQPEEEEEEEEPKRKVMVAKRTAPLPKRKSMGKAEESEAEASQPDDDEDEKPKKVATRAGPSPKKNGKGKDAKSDAETPPSQDEKAPAARPARKQLVRRVSGPGPRRSPRKAPDSKATTSKLPDLPSLPSFSDSDDFPAELAPPPKAPAPGGVIKVARVPPSAPPTRQSGAKAKAPPRKATPTPPSSPLSAPPSPNTHRRKVEVVVPTFNSLSASAKKAPPARTASQSVVSHHASAPPRSRLATTSARVASPASSAAAPEIGGRVKRTAAAKATQRLHDEIMPDVVNFQNEMRNRGRKGLGARRISGAHEADEEEEEEEEEPSKKKKGKARASTTTDEESVAEKPVKQARKSEVALRNGKPIKLMTTGVDLSDDVLKALANLGAKVTARATECTHLVVATLKRTEKFLCALPGAPFIVTKEWANESAAAESLLPEEDYLLQDDAAERKYGFSLSDAVERARELKGKLFKDLVFYVTPKVTTTPALMRSVVLANGGQIITNQLPSKRMLDMHPNRRVISCADDEYSCSPFADHHPIYTQELVLSSALRQKIDWDDFKL